LIRENIESLGYRLEDISILLTMQAHWDHVAAFSEIQEISGAKIWATEKDKRILEDGGFSDPHFGGRETFRPVKVDRIIRQGDLVSLGGLELMVHEHPGHTEGSASYSFKVREGGKDYDVVIANMGTINDGKKLVVEPTYEGVSEDFAGTYRRQKEMPVDVWVAAHGSQYNLHEKYSPGQSYDPETFVDPEGFVAEIDRLEGLYLRQLSSEMAMP
jgi:metallo-beta-lactamase class B